MKLEPKVELERLDVYWFCGICGRRIGKMPSPPWERKKGVHFWCKVRWFWQTYMVRH